MEKKKRYRNEWKYRLSEPTAAILKSRIASVMRPDSHSGGVYDVHNLYFDDWFDSAYYEKMDGAFSREKFRLRHYNNDLSFIRLERKCKDGTLCYKDTTPVTPAQYQSVLSGDLDFALWQPEPLWRSVGLLHRLRGLHPVVRFTYRREAFIYGPGNVRVTFDSSSAMPLLLEVKFDDFLPSVISGLLKELPLNRVENSKYCIMRERMNTPYARATGNTHAVSAG